MRPLLPAIPVAVFLALAAPAASYHCETYSTTQPKVACVAPGDVAGAYYVTEDCCGVAGPATCMWSMWAYEESNGIPGLQRGDEVVDDTCHGMIPSDTIIF